MRDGPRGGMSAAEARLSKRPFLHETRLRGIHGDSNPHCPLFLAPAHRDTLVSNGLPRS